jgi:hypothetical protein
MPITPIPILVVVLAVVGTTVSLWISQELDLVRQCRVLVDGCISISAAGRHPPAIHVFHATIIPHATLMMALWPLTAMWLRELGAGTPRLRAGIAILGGTSPILLIYYVVGLGQGGIWIEDIRLIVIRVFFVMALIAQTMTGAVLLRHAHAAPPSMTPVPPWLARALLWVAIVMALIAGMSVPVHFTLNDPSVPLNLMQWHASTVFLIWFLLLWLAWRITGFRRLHWHAPRRHAAADRHPQAVRAIADRRARDHSAPLGRRS